MLEPGPELSRILTCHPSDRGAVTQKRGKKPVDDHLDWLADLEGPRTRVGDFLPHALAGVALVCGFAIGAHFLDNRPVSVQATATYAEIINVPATTALSGGRGSLASSPAGDIVMASVGLGAQEVVSEGKSDMIMVPQVTARTGTANAETDGISGGKSLAPGALPSVAELEAMFDRATEAKKETGSARKFQLAEQACLARAVYFEARSESELGQMAVAQVILNRVKDPGYPKTICGVVYEGADRPNACQFSFACDSESDEPTNRTQWATAQRVAQAVISGKAADEVKIVAAATHYHADYVKPKWSNSLRQIIKIGRHIFYADS